MEKIASEENGHITKTLNYGNMYMDQHKETLETMMGRAQQPPLGPLKYISIYWSNEYRVTSQHGLDGNCIQKKVYVAYIPWDKVHDFLAKEETKMDVQCKFIQKNN
jgi:hypothetical protein